MKKVFFALLVLSSPLIAIAQSETTNALQKRYEDSFSLFFYKNTLRMLNQSNNKEFDELVKDIEKMKFMMVDKAETSFATSDYKKLINDYKAEKFEEIMTMRHEGKNFDIYLKERRGSTLGTVILVNDSTNLYVLDILGSIDVGKATKLFSTLNESSEIGKSLKSFIDQNGKGKGHRPRID